jgi:putative aldouronate transport system substrate-binding protein
VTWEIDIAPQPQFGEITATRLAGGDLPDIFYLNPQQGAPQQWQALAQGAFLDLTDYLTGDALQQFPNLATFPQYAWDNVRFQGRIYSVPKVTGARFSSLPFYRADWVDKLGIAHPTTPDSVREMLVAFSNGDPDGNGSNDTYGMARHWFGWHVMDNKLSAYMHRAPREWQVNPDGSLVFTNETPEFWAEVEWQARVFSEGGYHPDAASMTHPQAQAAFIAGQTGLHLDALTTMLTPGNILSKMQLNNPDARLMPYVPVGPDGQPGATWNDPGFFGSAAIPASSGDDEDRVLELLRILDYLAAPFGSEESNFFNYGIEGIHHTVSPEGARLINDQGRLERGDLNYPMSGIPVYYIPEQPDLGPQLQQIALSSAALGRDNPTIRLYSPTYVENGPALEQFGVDRIAAIVTGRDSMDSFDGAVQEWRERGGDQIRDEFQEALQQQGGA